MGNIVDKAINAILKADAPIAAVVSTRIHLDHLPQHGTRPALTYKLISNLRPLSHDGFIGPNRARISVTAHAEDYPTARNLAELVDDAMLGKVGTFAGVDVQGVFDEGMSPLYEDDPTIKEHFIPTDYMVHYV